MRGRKPSPQPKVSLTIQVDPELLQRLNDTARDARMSRARWVSLVLQDVLDTMPATEEPSSAPKPSPIVWDGSPV
jgi:predicted HicB family RNase H-like nuclease